MSAICRKILLKLALRMQTFVKRSHASTVQQVRIIEVRLYFVYVDQGNPSQDLEGRVNYTNSNQL